MNLIALIKSERMGFRSYWQSLKPEEKKQFAERAETSVAYLALIAGGHRRAASDFARRLISASAVVTPGRELTLEDIRPDWAQLTS